MTESKQIDILAALKELSYTQWLPRLAFFSMIVLKLTGLLTWSWWMVLAPVWMIPIMAGMVLAGTLLVGIIYLIWKSFAKLLEEYQKDRRIGKRLAKQQAMTTSQSMLDFVKRTLRFLFVG